MLFPLTLLTLLLSLAGHLIYGSVLGAICTLLEPPVVRPSDGEPSVEAGYAGG